MDSRLEERYIVIKLRDLSPRQRVDLVSVLNYDKIKTRDAVVVEADWPIYDAVVNMVFEVENEV